MKLITLCVFCMAFVVGSLSAVPEAQSGTCPCKNCKCTAENGCGCASGKPCTCSENGSCSQTKKPE